MQKQYSDLFEDIPAKNSLRIFYLINKLHEIMEVDIVLPTYNREDTIKRSIESVINQTHRNWNLFIWDDGSTDHTREVCDIYKSNSRIHYHHSSTNKGVSFARNQCLGLGNSEIVTYLDSDNLWHPDYLQNICSFMKKFSLESAYLGIKLIDENGIKGCIGHDFSWEKCFESNYVDLNCFAHTRNRLVNIQRKWNYNFDETIHRLVDWDFILRITEGIACKYLSLFLVDYYCGEQIRRITTSNYMQHGELADLITYIQNKHFPCD